MSFWSDMWIRCMMITYVLIVIYAVENNAVLLMIPSFEFLIFQLSYGFYHGILILTSLVSACIPWCYDLDSDWLVACSFLSAYKRKLFCLYVWSLHMIKRECSCLIGLGNDWLKVFSTLPLLNLGVFTPSTTQ
jgi:hypothetical protein